MKQLIKEHIARKPDWLKIRLPEGEAYHDVNEIVNQHHLHTICSSGRCPNMGECWGNRTATFMILGDICTRACRFCAVKTGRPLSPDPNEPVQLAKAIRLMKLRHAVITSVDRDDLPDKGAKHWADTIKAIKEENPETTLEVLIPDFDGQNELIAQVIDQQPEVISHNLETVRRLTNQIRTKARYDTSLKLIAQVAQSDATAKSGIMLGLGESTQEVYATMDDLLSVGCEVMTIGQYLQPSRQHHPVSAYITPEMFKSYEKTALQKGFRCVESAPLVRSSYHAHKHVKQKKK